MANIDIEKPNRSSSKELLLADHKYLCDSFRENEQIGERRIKFFITLVTAVMAASATLATSSEGIFNIKMDDDKRLAVIIFFALFFLLVIGIITLLRMIKRNSVTDGYKKDLDDIRQIFRDYYDEECVLEYYSPFHPQKIKANTSQNKKEAKEQIEVAEESKNNIKIRKFGGLTHMTSAINSLVFAGLIGILLVRCNIYIIIAAIVIACVLSFLGQYMYIKRRAKENKDKIKEFKYSHAGGIVYRLENNKLKFLVITAKENKSHFVFPKGHIEEDEDHKSTAIREVLEESGVLTRVKRPVGSICFSEKEENGKKKDNTIKFYLMEYLDQLNSKNEGRLLDWYEYNNARDLLSFPESKELLVKAKSIIDSEYLDKTRAK
jgi:8-oxo-dGTP pyrophosphatase MutT (NUDIX family)